MTAAPAKTATASIFSAPTNVMVMDNHHLRLRLFRDPRQRATNIQISNNQCLRSGETAIYVEFGFEGAVVSGNMIDGAANGILDRQFQRRRQARDRHRQRRPQPELTVPTSTTAPVSASASRRRLTRRHGNVIENAPNWGLQLGWGPYLRNVVATGNVVRNAAAAARCRSPKARAVRSSPTNLSGRQPKARFSASNGRRGVTAGPHEGRKRSLRPPDPLRQSPRLNIKRFHG